MLDGTVTVLRLVIYFFPFWDGVEPNPLLLRPLIDLLYQPRMMIDDDERGAEKTCPTAALPTTNPT
jgi:hypothetical protein